MPSQVKLAKFAKLSKLATSISVPFFGIARKVRSASGFGLKDKGEYLIYLPMALLNPNDQESFVLVAFGHLCVFP